MARGTRYHVVSKIAKGGMAEIFLALQQGEQGFQKPVVLKRILPSLAADPKFVRMFVDEAHIASTLNHSNLVQVLDLGRSGGQYFLVLEFVDGWSLEQIRRRAQAAKLKLPVPLALTIVSALCRGLAYVHTRERNGQPLGIVHRDVTPQNVLISQHGEVKLADFGIAKAIGKGEKSATGSSRASSRTCRPSSRWRSRWTGAPICSRWAPCSTSSRPGASPSTGRRTRTSSCRSGARGPRSPRRVVRDLNPDVERLITRALRASPGKRWQSAEQMADKIDAILVKLGQPSGPAPLKRWLETLSAKDGAKPPVPVAPPSPDPSIAVDLGSMDLELEEVARRRPSNRIGARASTRVPSAPAPSPARPTRPPGRTRHGPPGWRRPTGPASRPPKAEPGRGGFKRWVRRMTIRAVLIVVALGGGFYFAHPHLPAWAKQPIDNWLRSLYAPVESRQHPPDSRRR